MSERTFSASQLLQVFEDYRPDHKILNSWSRGNWARFVARHLPKHLPKNNQLDQYDPSAALNVADMTRTFIELFVSHGVDSPYRAPISLNSNYTHFGDMLEREAKLYGLNELLCEVLGAEFGSQIYCAMDAESSVVLQRTIGLERVLPRLLEHAVQDEKIVFRAKGSSTVVTLYTGRDGAGNFDTIQLTLRPEDKQGGDEIVFRGDTETNRLQPIVLFAPLGTMISLCDDVIARWSQANVPVRVLAKS